MFQFKLKQKELGRLVFEKTQAVGYMLQKVAQLIGM